VALCLSGAGFLVFVFLMLESSTAIAFGIALVVFNASWNFSLPYQMDLISQADPETRYIVLVPAAQTIGGAIGPAIAGSLLMSSGVAAIYVQMVIGIGVAFFLYGLIARRMRTR
jgi:ABC-type phosphate transport system permease subunit